MIAQSTIDACIWSLIHGTKKSTAAFLKGREDRFDILVLALGAIKSTQNRVKAVRKVKQIRQDLF